MRKSTGLTSSLPYEVPLFCKSAAKTASMLSLDQMFTANGPSGRLRSNPLTSSELTYNSCNDMVVLELRIMQRYGKQKTKRQKTKRHALPASAKCIPAKICQATAHPVVGQRQNRTNLNCPHWQCCPGENKIKLRTKLPQKKQKPILTHLTVHKLPTRNQESYPHKKELSYPG